MRERLRVEDGGPDQEVSPVLANLTVPGDDESVSAIVNGNGGSQLSNGKGKYAE